MSFLFTETFTETRQTTNIVDNIKKGNLTKTKNLISNTSVNKILDSSGNTALHYAIMFKQYDIIQYLLSIGANELLKNITGDDCRTLACRYFSLEFFDVKNNETKDLKKTILTQTNEIVSLKDSLIEWKNYYDKLNKKFIILNEQNTELKTENIKLKRKLEFVEDSFNQLSKKHKK